MSGISKPIFLESPCFALQIPIVFVISVVAVISVPPACGCLMYFCRFHCCRRFRESHRVAKRRCQTVWQDCGTPVFAFMAN